MDNPCRMYPHTLLWPLLAYKGTYWLHQWGGGQEEPSVKIFTSTWFGLLCPLSLPSGHDLNQISTNLHWYFIPFHLQPLPKMFNRVQVRWLWRPLQNIDILVLEPFWGKLRGVFGVIILLEDEVHPIQPIKLHCFEEVILKNAGVQLSIHSPIYSFLHMYPTPWGVMQHQTIRDPPQILLSHWYSALSAQIQAFSTPKTSHLTQTY